VEDLKISHFKTNRLGIFLLNKLQLVAEILITLIISLLAEVHVIQLGMVPLEGSLLIVQPLQLREVTVLVAPESLSILKACLTLIK